MTQSWKLRVSTFFYPNFGVNKYALESMHGIVYVLVLDAGGAALMAGRSFEVDHRTLSFYRVLSIEVRLKMMAVFSLFNR